MSRALLTKDGAMQQMLCTYARTGVMQARATTTLPHMSAQAPPWRGR